MSRSSSIEVRFSTSNCWFLVVLSKLESNGWYMNDFGGITFLPISDDGQFEWKHESHTTSGEARIREIIGKKERNKELAGVVLLWQDSQSGGEFLFDPRGYLLLSISVNQRKLQTDQGVTDVSWYLERLALSKIDEEVTIESISWSEHA